MITLTLPIHARRILLILASIAIFLAIQSIAGQLLLEHHDSGADTFVSVYAQLTNSNLESSIPTWYSSSLLLFSSGLLSVIAITKRIHKDRYARHWIGLAIIFLYMSLDEGAMIHEELTDPMRALFNVTNYLYFAWMIVGIPVALVVAAIYLRFVIELPAHIRRLFILAGISYIGGAVVIEAFSANMWFLNDGGSLPYMIVGSIEEFFEMMGVITLIYALLQYIRDLQVNINLYPAADTTPDNRPHVIAAAAESPSRVTVILLLSGTCLALMQWLLVRELAALPADNGPVVPTVVMMTLVTLFIGFNLSSWLPPALVLSSGAISLLLHLTLPLWLRLFFVELEKIGGATLAWVLPSIVGAFLVSGFVSLFLPHFSQNNRKQIIKHYGALLFAAAGTVLVLQLLHETATPVIRAAYTLGAAGCMIALRLRRPMIGLFAAFSLVWLMAYPHLDYSTNSLLFQTAKGLPSGTTTLFSGYSRYQKVDILQSPEGDRYLYLNGQISFDSDQDSRFNNFLAKIPAMLVQPDHALVLGAGSMHLERLLAEYAGHVTTVDKDWMLIQASLDYFDDFNRMSSLANRTVIIDYPERYIARTTAQYELLTAGASISGDSAGFYRAAAQILTPNGVVVADLAGKFATQDEAPQQLAASLTSIFGEVMILTPDSSDRSVAFAADRLPFTREALSDILQAQGEIQFTIFDVPAVYAIVGDQRTRPAAASLRPS